MVIKMLVYARTRFVAFHQWEDAPEKYRYLARPHRHEFHVEVGVRVTESDRQVEFHELKRFLDTELRIQFGASVPDGVKEPKPIRASCEVMAEQLGRALTLGYCVNVAYVDVSEDGECGGRVEWN